MRQVWIAIIGALLCIAIGASAGAQAAGDGAPASHALLVVPAAARPGPAFDVERATEAYLASVPAAQRARSDAYFEGGYWLVLWDLLYGFAIAALLLYSGAATGLRDRLERLTKRAWLQTLAYAAAYLLAVAVLALPEGLYRDYWREHYYGLSNLTLAGWFGEWLKLSLIDAAFGALFLVPAYAVMRRYARWWQPVALVATVFLYFGELVVPVYVAPIFNHYQSLPDGPVRSGVLSLARANGVPASDVYWFDASRQTSRISANVSGLGSTLRISLNDNLLREASVPEILAVTGHELGHYVLDHTLTFPIEFGLLVAAIAAATQWLSQALVRLAPRRLGLRDGRDLAALPLVAAVAAFFFFLATPVLNTLVRTQEIEADLFGLNAAREPHGFASAALHLSTYRKLSPGRLEEIVFYDHPSGRARIHAAMTWFAEHQDAGAAGTAAR